MIGVFIFALSFASLAPAPAGAVEVTLSWHLNSANPAPPTTHTRVYRAPAPCSSSTGKFALVASGLNGTSWTDENVQAGKTYCYFTTVRNPRTKLESGKSDVVTITP